MKIDLFDTFRNSLLEKRRNLTEWILTVPSYKKDTRLGTASDQDLQKELRVIDEAIEKAEDHTLGQCEVCHETVDYSLLQMDYTACVCLDHFSEKEKRDLEFELELAQSVQKAMLPQRVPDIPGMEVGAYSRPAQMIGGDYFDFFQFSNGNHGIAIGDAVGHGVSSSLLMASLHATLEALIPMVASPVEVIQRINHLFCHNIKITTFASLFLSSFDPGTYQLNYTNAGHNPPLLLRDDAGGAGELVSLDPTGAAIGLVDGVPYFSKTLQLMPGDLLLFYTDGVVETMNPGRELFGTERLEAQMRQHFQLPARELIQTLVSVLKEYSQNGSVLDDTTIIACRVTPQNR